MCPKIRRDPPETLEIDWTLIIHFFLFRRQLGYSDFIQDSSFYLSSRVELIDAALITIRSAMTDDISGKQLCKLAQEGNAAEIEKLLAASKKDGSLAALIAYKDPVRGHA